MITKDDEALIRRAKDGLSMITCKGSLSEKDRKALEHIAKAGTPNSK